MSAGRRRAPSEIGPRPKEWGKNFRIALVYPGPYRVGMANLGFHAVYAAINSREGMLADRFFVEHGARGPLKSVERGMPLAEYGCAAFSVHFEPDYANVVRALAAGGLEPLACRRSERDPVVIAGGPALSANPEPLADFLDAVFAGEFESGGPELLEKMKRLRASGAERAGLPAALAGLPRVYVPSLAAFTFEGPKTISFRGLEGMRLPVESSRPPLEGLPPPVTAVYTDSAEFSDMALVELSRGCTGGCRFCMNGFTTRPFRTFGTGGIVSAIKTLKHRKKAGLVGELFGAHPGMEAVSAAAAGAGVRLSPSSLRLENLNEGLLESLAGSGVKTLTLAPETGSERLAKAMNKPLDRAAFVSAVSRAIGAGIENVRMYVMLGLPGEKDADVAETASLAREARMILAAPGGRKRLGRLTLSVNPFIPKPWTPLQWEPMARRDLYARRADLLSEALGGLPNMEIRVSSFDECAWEAALSRADRRAGAVLAGALSSGWRRALHAVVDGAEFQEAFAFRPRDDGEVFPWEVVSHGVTRRYLAAEREKYGLGETTPACDPDSCRACGAC